MGISKKGKRTITYQDKKYVWWVREEEECCNETWLTVASEDKSLILSYRVGECDFFVISKGRVFQGRETSGRWERYWYPFQDRTPPMVITPGFVRELLAWAVDGWGAERVLWKKPTGGLLYRLVLSDDELAYGNYKEEFDIGIFSSREGAKRVAEHYLRNVKGFRDYKCSYRIVEKKVFGWEKGDGEKDGGKNCGGDGNGGNGGREKYGEGICDEVYVVYGWDENEEGDEVEIIESDCFAGEAAAKREMARMKEQYVRSEWSLTRYRVNEWKWTDGFVRV